MAMYTTTVNYNVNDLDQLTDYINNISGHFADILTGLAFDTDGQRLTVLTNEEMSQQNILDLEDALVVYTNPSTVPSKQVITLSSGLRSFSNTNYTTAYQWQENKGKSMYSVVMTSSLEPFKRQDVYNLNFTYTVRVYNVSTHQAILENTYSNTDYTENEMMLNSIDIKTNQQYELQIKSNLQNCIVNVSSLIIKYD